MLQLGLTEASSSTGLTHQKRLTDTLASNLGISIRVEYRLIDEKAQSNARRSTGFNRDEVGDGNLPRPHRALHLLKHEDFERQLPETRVLARRESVVSAGSTQV
ncbi:hypothetical protein MMC32_008346 [Xylographa parallela]|nr:hypothetical protein [Xylographa parallela]